MKKLLCIILCICINLCCISAFPTEENKENKCGENVIWEVKDGVLYDKNIETLIAYPVAKNGVTFTIPDSVTSIDSFAFSDCDSLKDITIPGSVISIDDYIFNDCDNLNEILYLGNNMDIIKKLHSESPDFTTVYYYEISVSIDGSILSFGQPPIMVNDRVMVPMQKIFEVLGYNVEWDNDTQTVVAKKGNNAIIVQINNSEIFHTDGVYLCDVAPVIESDRTLVPLRAIAECAGRTVEWDDETKTVIITTI